MLDRYQRIADRILAILHNIQHIPLLVRRNHHLMQDSRSLRHLRNDSAPVNPVTLLYGHVGLPFLFRIQGTDIHTAADVGTAGLCDLAQRPLDTIKNIGQNARGQGNGYRCSGSRHKLARPDSGRLLIYLDNGVPGL